MTLLQMVNQPYDFVKQQVVLLNSPSSAFLYLIIVLIYPQASGTAEVSFTSTLLEGKPLNAEEEFDLKWSAASLYSGRSYPYFNIYILV